MILKNEAEILKMQLKESEDENKNLSEKLEEANKKISIISEENNELKDRVEKLLKEIEILKENTKENRCENVVKSISKPPIKKLIESAPM